MPVPTEENRVMSGIQKEMNKQAKAQKRAGFDKFKDRFAKPNKAELVQKLKEIAKKNDTRSKS